MEERIKEILKQISETKYVSLVGEKFEIRLKHGEGRNIKDGFIEVFDKNGRMSGFVEINKIYLAATIEIEEDKNEKIN